MIQWQINNDKKNDGCTSSIQLSATLGYYCTPTHLRESSPHRLFAAPLFSRGTNVVDSYCRRYDNNVQEERARPVLSSNCPMHVETSSPMHQPFFRAPQPLPPRRFYITTAHASAPCRTSAPVDPQFLNRAQQRIVL
jgi:hypothetical protein